MNAKYWLIYKQFYDKRITKPFATQEGMERFIKEAKNIEVVARTKPI